jgi:hypothetical protein
MFLTIRLTTLCKESLAFQIHLTSRTIEAFRMPVIVKSFDPSVAGFNGELTTIALSLEHCCPVFLTVDFALFQVEGAAATCLVTVDTLEALRMEGVLQGIHTFPDNGFSTFTAAWCKVLFIISLTEELSFFLHESHPDQGYGTLGVTAREVVRAPGLVQGQDKWSSDGNSASRTERDSCSS